ncbi:hypothetical protein FSP39_003811 [Pinctada imbricata]|uniref:Kazal-like domain-containing protein n=1 Tax=Pinctada imbricata TaxID=66713 RepID=A0AA89BUS9_PINIB|nr:hypothetical protein FSP39_003811 [Pinctada imbricata]
MNFFQLFTTFLSLHKNPQQNQEFHPNHHHGRGHSNANQDLRSNMLKFPVNQDHFDPFMKPENQFDIGTNMVTTPPVLATPINNEFLKTIPFFNENIFGNNNRNGLNDRRGQRFNSNSNNALNGRREDQRRRNAGIIHRFQETNIVPTEIPAGGILASDSAFSGITPVNIDAILAGIHVAKHDIGCDCPPVWQPVCGTDNALYSKTYVNYCAMTCVSGVTKIYDGECWPSHISRFFFATTSRPNRRSRTSATSVAMEISPIRNTITRITDVTRSSTLEPVTNRTSLNSGTNVVSKTTVSRTTPSPSVVKTTTIRPQTSARNSLARAQSNAEKTNNVEQKSTVAIKAENTVMDSKINTLTETNNRPIQSKETKEKLSPAKSLKLEPGAKFLALKETAKDLVSKQVNDQLKTTMPNNNNEQIAPGSDVTKKKPKDALQQDLLGFDPLSMDPEMASFDKMLNDLMMKKKQGAATA